MARPLVGRVFDVRFRTYLGSQRGFLTGPRQSGSGRIVENLNLRKLSKQSQDYHRNRRNFLLAGAVAGVISFVFTAWKLKQQLAKNPVRQDAGPTSVDATAGGAAGRKVIVHDDQGREIVPTGNGVVPNFPRLLHVPNRSASSPPTQPTDPSVVLPGLDSEGTEYTLVGLGLRTVSFLGLQVYVVGFYVATADIAALQAALIKKINPIATTLVPTERDQLRTQLLDAVEGQNIWDGLLRDGLPGRSLFRVVPVRDTDFHHLRDGFVRAIQARSNDLALEVEASPPGEGADLSDSVRTFRSIFNRGRVPKRKELLLQRDAQGRLSVVYDDGGSGESGHPGGRQLIGTVDDERLSRALWLNYLAGRKVASEAARGSIVEGVMEFVERPVGTVATQVVAVVP